METFMLWLSRSSVIITTVVLLFQLLRFDRNFRRNRYFLLSGLLLSLVLPAIPFGSTAASGIAAVVNLNPVTVNASGIHDAMMRLPDMFNLVWVVYLAGVVFLTLRMLWQIVGIIGIARHARVFVRQRYKLVITDKAITPFSFMNWIFVSRMPDGSDSSAMFSHERTHAMQWHSVDVVLMELCAILQWFNPFVWLYRTNLREVHEYLADHAALQGGVPRLNYLRLLLSMAMNVQPKDISNNFCQIKIKRRLAMITKDSRSRLTGLKFAFTCMVLGSALWFVSCGNAQNKDDKTTPDTEQVSGTPADSSVYTVVENMPVYPGGDEARVKFIIENVKYPVIAKEKGIQGTVFVSFVVETDGTVADVKVVRGIGGGCDEEATRVVKLMPKWSPGKQSGKVVRVQFNMPIKFALS